LGSSKTAFARKEEQDETVHALRPANAPHDFLFRAFLDPLHKMRGATTAGEKSLVKPAPHFQGWQEHHLEERRKGTIMIDPDIAKCKPCARCSMPCFLVFGDQQGTVALCTKCLDLIGEQWTSFREKDASRGITAKETVALAFTQLVMTVAGLQRTMAVVSVESTIKKGYEMASVFFAESAKHQSAP
jgi:hypothetical protein